VWGRLLPARDSLACGALPIGLAHGVRLTRAVAKGAVISWQDIAAIDNEAALIRRQMEAEFAASWDIRHLRAHDAHQS
jgi:predicted homoserine dehydrogenase-like protein